MKTEAEIEITFPQAKEHLEPPEAGRGKEGSSPTALKGSLSHPVDFRLLASRQKKKERVNCYGFKSPSLW